jgi:hypothetical protein
MGIPLINIHVLEQVVFHVMPVGIGIGREQTNVLVEVERAAK